MTNPLVKIRSERDQMSAIERRIADFILDNAHLLRDYSSQQLASALGISQSSVVKFAQKSGFKGYPDLKYTIGEAIARNGNGHTQLPEAVQDDAPDAYQRLQDGLRRSKLAAEEETRSLNPRTQIEPIGVGRRLPFTEISACSSSIAETWARDAAAPWIIASGRLRGTRLPSSR